VPHRVIADADAGQAPSREDFVAILDSTSSFWLRRPRPCTQKIRRSWMYNSLVQNLRTLQAQVEARA